jgi:hypothetical protein
VFFCASGHAFCVVGGFFEYHTWFCGCVLGLFSTGIVGEFDPGSGRTLAACLTHASRTLKHFRVWMSGERVSNTWVICPALWDKPWKRGLIPDMTHGGISCVWKVPAVQDEPAAYQLVGGVMAYQGDDG